MADAYRLKGDASFPKALRKQGEDLDGNPTYLTEGRNYVAGSYIFADDMTPRDRERADNGELDHLLDSASRDEAEDYYTVRDKGLFIPEHEAESVILEEYGHEVVPKDQVLELRAAGSDDAASAQEAALADDAGERPNLTRAEYPSLAEVSREGADNVPVDSEHVDDDRIAEAPSASHAGVEAPPGIAVGEAKAEQEGAEPKRRGRPKGSTSKPKAAVKQHPKPVAKTEAQK